MDKPIPDIMFKGMSFFFKIRDFISPRKDVLEEVGIKPGFHVLDFGCGPGSYSVIAAELVGASGKVYALDIHPLSSQKIREAAARKNLTNIKTICSGCATGLEDGSVDAALLYDTFHMLSNKQAVLNEIHRTLKPEGILSFSDHHMKEDKILPGVTNGGLFKLSVKGKKTYTFLKEKQ